ncbi:gag-pol polyprotein, partial [Tanacetum coccineum]
DPARTTHFGNDHFATITGYGDYVQSNLKICYVYYVEGLRHNLFLVGQFCDGDLEVAFRSNTCYVLNLEGDDLLTGSRDLNLYTISIYELAATSPVCLMSKATSTKSWLWHRRLSHLNFGTINQLTSKDLVDGLPNLSMIKITYVKILKIRTDNGTEFKNEKLRSFYAKLGIVHNTSIARTPKQNGVVECRNLTLVEAARTMLIFSKTPEFLWAEAIATACFTQNRSIDPVLTPRIFKIHWKIYNQYRQKTDLDNLFGPLYEEYYATSTPEVSDISAANTLDNEDTPSSSSIVVEEDEAPQIVSSSAEPVATEPNTPVSNENADELVQEDAAELDGNIFHNPLHTPMFEEAESSSTYQDPSNMHEFHQTHRSTNKWAKNHPIEQVIVDPLKPVMTRHRLHTDTKVCMYALTVSTTEPKNIKEAMLDHKWIESMQDELNQFKRLDVLEHVECPVGRNIIAVKWIWKNKTDYKNTVIQNKSRLVAKGYDQEEGIDF